MSKQEKLVICNFIAISLGVILMYLDGNVWIAIGLTFLDTFLVFSAMYVSGERLRRENHQAELREMMTGIKTHKAGK